MSRLRSQLENLMTEEAATGSSQSQPGTFRPAYGSSQQSASASPREEIVRIQQSIDHLMNKLASGAQFSNPPAQAPQGGADNEAFRAEIRAGFQKLRETFSSTVDRLEAAGNPQVSEEIETNLNQIIAKLDDIRGSETNPDAVVEQLQAELAGLHQGISSLLEREQAQPDLSRITETIESGYSDIVARLDAALAANQCDFEKTDYTPHFHALSEQMLSLAKTIEQSSVPGQAQHVAGGQDVSDNTHAFERIEARLASLGKSVDALMKSGNEALAGTPYEGQSDLVMERLDAIARDLADMQGRNTGSGQQSDLSVIEKQLGKLSQRVGDLTRIAEEASSQEPTEGFADTAGLEERLAEIASKLETLAGMPTGPGSDNDNQEVLELLGKLAEKIDRISDPGAAEMHVDLKPIEDKLASLSEAILGNAGAAVDFAALAERLDNIEGQITSSRDIVIDLAQEYQAKVTSGGEFDTSIINSIMSELKSLRDSVATALSTEENDESKLDEIGARLMEIADRISGIEAASIAALEVTADEGSPGKKHKSSDVLDRKFMDESVIQPARRGAPIDEESSMGASAPRLQPELDDDTTVQATGPAGDLDGGTQDAMSAEAVAIEAGCEDVPLAPGSGMPDLESLVRKAKQIKREKPQQKQAGSEEADEGESDGIADLMAAARRAAQAASAEAENSQNQQSSKKKLGSLGGLKLPGFLNRKTLMASGAVILVAAAGMMIAPKFFGGSPQPTKIAGEGSESSSLDIPEVAIASRGNEDSAQSDVMAGADNDMSGEQQAESVQGMSDSVTAGGVAQAGPESGIDDNAQMAATDARLQGESESMPSGQSLQPDLSDASISADEPHTPPAEVGNDALRTAAAAGDGDAMFEIGRRYTDGIGVDRNLETAALWYTSAAEGGHAPAQYRIGNFYEKGHGVAVDPKSAAEWYGKAAAQGNALAMHNLAVLHAMGLVDGDANMDESLAWFEKAANLGVKDSQVNLGILFTKGMGVTEDLEQAYKWFSVAAKGGDTDAAKKRDTVAQAMRPEQLERARGAAELWKPQELVEAANFASVADEWKDGKAETLSLSKKEMVRKAQSLLASAGFDVGPADGVFGDRTRTAIMSFQSKAGLPVDGEVSPALLDALSKQSI